MANRTNKTLSSTTIESEPTEEKQYKLLGKMLEPLDFFESSPKKRQDHIEELLSRHLNMKTVVAFIGAGTSLPLGYPNWGTLAEDILSILIVVFEDESFWDDAIKAKKDGYNSITQKLEVGDLKNEKEIAKKNYQINKDNEKKADPGIEPKNTFPKYLNYIKNPRNNELGALFIFSECERLLNTKESWDRSGENNNRPEEDKNWQKQSRVFRKIVEFYFDHKYEKAEESLQYKIAGDRVLLKHGKNLTDEAYDQKKAEEKAALDVEIADKNHKERKQLYEKYNPYLALLKLPIKKFTTFNYDLEIERALLYNDRIKSSLTKDEIYSSLKEKIIENCKPQSFSQEKQFHNELARFSVARYEGGYFNVFHCHGRIDNTAACVVSEEDYKKWYLREDSEEYTPFRQTLDISLDSNPILFIGFGLKDADLMRILRTINANRSTEKTRNPLFCLLYIGETDIKNDSDRQQADYKWQTNDELEHECAALYMKYGLHVIPVKAKEIKEKADGKLQEGDAMCLKLIELQDKWRNWWEGILKKPNFRRFEPVSGNSYYHYKFKTVESEDIAGFDENFHSRLNEILNFDVPSKESSGNIEQVKETTTEQKRLEKKKSKNSPSEERSTDEARRNAGGKDSLFAPNLAIVVGDGGTGKSWSVQSYLEKMAEDVKRNNGKIFYWSSYYANDVLTGIDRLIDFFKTGEVKDGKDQEEQNKNEPKERQGLSKFERLKEIVDNEENSIIVFDGIEKLLTSNKENTEGESVSPEVKQFFKIISNGQVRCKIIITTRLFPTDILFNLEERLKDAHDFEGETWKNSFEEYTNLKKVSPVNFEDNLLNLKTIVKKVKTLSAPRCWQEDLKDDADFKIYGDDDCDNENELFISSICSLFEGHIFGISLMKRVVRKLNQANKKSDENFLRQVRQIIRDIANTPIEKRIDRIIQEAVRTVDKCDFVDINWKPAKEFIQRIALFMHPVREEIAQVCFGEICQRGSGLEAEIDEKLKKSYDECFHYLLDTLVQSNLLQKVEIQSSDKTTCEQTNEAATAHNREDYVVHPLVRSYVFERIHESRFNSYPSLQLPGFTSGKEVVDPGSKDGKNVATSLFKALCKEAVLEDEATGSDMCRGAFSLLRSRFCSNTVARWGNYTDYTKLTLLLYDTAKTVSKEHWDYVEPTRYGFEKCSDPSGPLYPDELAWVYNEVGLASQSMGNNLNATALWEQGFEISKLIDRDREGRYLFQSNINLGAIYIYYGKLNIARDYLNKAFEIANKLENKKLSGRVVGYIALVKYLRGNLEEANIEFKKACEELIENPRARAVFMNFHGELLLKLNKEEEALEKIEQSRHIAESEYYPDLIAYARLSKANYFQKEGDHIEAQGEYQFVLKYSKEVHLRRLEAATLSGMSRLADKLGDFSTAIRLATDSLKISNEYLLSLHQTQGLIVLGKALINGHQHRDLGIACLQTAKDVAQRQEYFLRMNEAKEELAKHNIN